MCRNTLPTQSSEAVRRDLDLGNSDGLGIHEHAVRLKLQSLLSSLSLVTATYPSRCHGQVTDSLNHFRKLRVKWHPDTGMAMETDGTIASL